MDGIFGVGIGEVVIIVLVILIIGGPENAMKWSRDLGRFLRQMRDLWGQMMSELEKDLGDDGKEIMNVTREFTRNINDARSAANPRRLVREASKLIEEAVEEADQEITTTLKESDEALKKALQKSETPAPERFSAWLPGDEASAVEKASQETSQEESAPEPQTEKEES